VSVRLNFLVFLCKIVFKEGKILLYDKFKRLETWMRSRRFLNCIIFMVFLGICIVVFRSLSPAGAKANTVWIGSLSPEVYQPEVYLPLLRKDPMRMATLIPTDTPVPTPGSEGCPSLNGLYEQQLYALINQTRDDYGLPALIPNDPLETSAGRHSDDMAINHFISHTGSDGSTFCDRITEAGYPRCWGGEIIMYANSPQAAMDWWMGGWSAPGYDLERYERFWGGLCQMCR
jgi:hypothetical protein